MGNAFGELRAGCLCEVGGRVGFHLPGFHQVLDVAVTASEEGAVGIMVPLFGPGVGAEQEVFDQADSPRATVRDARKKSFAKVLVRVDGETQGAQQADRGAAFAEELVGVAQQQAVALLRPAVGQRQSEPRSQPVERFGRHAARVEQAVDGGQAVFQRRKHALRVG